MMPHLMSLVKTQSRMSRQRVSTFRCCIGSGGRLFACRQARPVSEVLVSGAAVGFLLASSSRCSGYTVDLNGRLFACKKSFKV
ncbi:MAG: hypothetical protein LBB43_02230 [Spirochaetaceae bacterium]|nr:hypothetical protein [Spirochaetaceae bacterium]